MTETGFTEFLRQNTQQEPRMLGELFAHQQVKRDAQILDVCDDSRDIKPGDAFLCLPTTGNQADEYIKEAERRGAAAVVTIGLECSTSLPHVRLESMKELGLALRRWFDTLQSPACLGVTGTDGKTSVAWMLLKALSRMEHKAWAVGTLGLVGLEETPVPLSNTTPPLLTNHRILALATKRGVSHVVFEVSSHGIAQERIAGIEFMACVWTNMGHDHIEYHGSFENYAATKARFVGSVVQSGGQAVINADATEVSKRAPAKAWRYGRGLYRNDVDLAWEQELPRILRLRHKGRERTIEDVPEGEFHAENLAAVSSVLLSVFAQRVDRLPSILNDLPPPPGRMELVGVHQGGRIFIDYAHTPEALRACLESARQLTRKRLLIVFGCGGERDRAKRPEMGEIAADLADEIWITTDNPRSEPPEVIAAEVVQGIPQPHPAVVHLELDRCKAIAQAIAALHEQDVLVIAGKGHEPYMDVGGKKLPWSDKAVVEKILSQEGLKRCA